MTPRKLMELIRLERGALAYVKPADLLLSWEAALAAVLAVGMAPLLSGLYFRGRLSGLTGDPAAIAAVAKAYRVYFKKVPLDQGGYTMDHTAIVYLMDKEGRFVSPFSLKRAPDAAAADLRRYL